MTNVTRYVLEITKTCFISLSVNYLKAIFFPHNFQQLKYEKKMKKSFAFSLLSLRYPYSPVYVLGLDKSIF